MYYRLDGDRVIEMRMIGADINTRYVFTYDAQGRPYTVTCYSGSSTYGITYYYVLNLQGDVIQIVDVENEVIANYRYDAWGKVLDVTDKNGSRITSSTHIGNINPIRYRGYFYDTETELYYCNSRYYDPLMKRFINADGTVSTGQGFVGFNMFAYCLNNPIIYVDSEGKDAILLYDSDDIGHIGALIQDENGTWRHFYWGTKGLKARFLCAFGKNVTPHTWFVSYDGKISLNAINESKQYNGDYEAMEYFHGDFSESARLAKNVTGKYNLYTNNCSQKTLNILAQSGTRDSEVFSKAAEKMLPRDAFKYVHKNRSNYVGDFPNRNNSIFQLSWKRGAIKLLNLASLIV